jgi:5'-nucleotidase
MVTMTLTGAQIETLLEQQFAGCLGQGATNRILQVSNGFAYSWSASAPSCGKVDPTSIMINGVVVDPLATYRVTVNSFLADGGDGFTVLTQGTNRLGGEVDTDALEKYFVANSPVAPGPMNRITRLP